MKLEEFVGKFLKLEESLGLLDLKIRDVLIWQYIRMEVYYVLVRKLNILEPTKISQQNPIVLIKNFTSLFLNLFRRNPFLISRKGLEIIVPHSRSKNIDGKLIDIYTEYYSSSLAFDDHIIFEKPHNGKHDRTPSKNTYYLDFIVIMSILSKFFVGGFSSNEKKCVDKINKIFQEEFKITISFNRIFLKNIARFKTGYWLYKKLLKKIKPTKLSLVVSYSYYGDLIAACKDLNIPVYEFQHGVISQYHLGYHYPNSLPKNNYFPNYFYSWGNYWSDTCKLPLGKERILNRGFDHFRKTKSNYKIDKKKGRILVISQGAIGSQLASCILSMMTELTNFTLYYKLHPEEYEMYSSYPAINQLLEYKNFHILFDVDLYQEFAMSQLQIGVFSTALFEGMSFGCKTLLLDIPGVEYMKDLLFQFPQDCRLYSKSKFNEDKLKAFMNGELNNNNIFF